MIRSILIIVFLVLFFLVGIVIWGVTWIIGRFDPYKQDLICLRAVQFAFRVVLLISGVKVEVYGEEHVPKGEAVLYIGNHRSLFDTVITYARCPRLTGYVAKDSMLKVPFLRIWMKRLHCLFLDRKDIKAGMKMILTGIDQIKNGISMCIFPEGTRSLTECETDMLPFKEGSFKMAEKTGCAIIPMAMVNTADIFEKHVPFVRRTHVILTYGEPIYVKELEKEQRKHLGSYVQETIRGMLQEQLKMNDKNNEDKEQLL
ncbi:MAG: 1-acyl-sn-glycerol-3-phosphate acyltransferase [Eubacterium sp.]|nr:1-acyl-sn-glycerol-3-phosphate acyltransferase [Eubacterium sp.]